MNQSCGAMWRIETLCEGVPYFLCLGSHAREYLWTVNQNDAQLFGRQEEAQRVATDAIEDLTLKGFGGFDVKVVKI